MLNKKDLKELVLVTRQHIQLREAVIEKDYYVTRGFCRKKLTKIKASPYWAQLCC